MTKLVSAIRRHEYWFVLALIATAYILCATQEGTNPSAFAFIAQLATLVVILWVAGGNPRAQRLSWVLLGLAVLAVAAVEISGTRGRAVDLALALASACACVLASSAIIAHQIRLRRPGTQNLIAAVSAYVLVGMLFTFIYNAAAQLSPAPVLDGAHGDSFRAQLFFSFSTLTTVGYGNVVPVGPVVESIAIAEAITGQLFLIVGVASMIAARTFSPRLDPLAAAVSASTPERTSPDPTGSAGD